MLYTRVLRKGMSGADVRFIKELLFELDYYTGVSKIASNRFGSDTVKAVRKYQSQNRDIDGKKLSVDGVVGKKTWGSIVAAATVKKPTEVTTTNRKALSPKAYPNIHPENLKAISDAIANISDARYVIVTEILHYAYDPMKGGDITALYMWGENLYDKSLTLNVADKALIEKGASRYPDKYDDGRKQMMLNAIKKNPSLVGSDCSGMEVGYLRKHKYVKASFDTTANNLCSDSFSTAISRTKLTPADWVGYPGHIGTFVGANFVVEFAGGAYGCQLTDLTKRIRYSFVNGKLYRGKAWTKFRDPKYY